MIIDKIGFLVHCADLIHHYGCICQKLEKDSYEFLLLDMSPGETEFLTGWLSERGIAYRSIRNLSAPYKVLVSNHCMSGSKEEKYLPEMIGVFNVRFMYALGKDAWHFADWNEIYDLILCYGPYQAQNLRQFKRPVTLQVGYPRYDDYFSKEWDRGALAAQFGCDPARETILWLPTWKQLSSLNEGYIAEVSKLTRFFNVVVKPHPLTTQCFDAGEALKMQLLRSHKFTCLIDSFHDNSALLRLADHVIADYGGSSFGAIYTDKHLILLNVEGAPEHDNIKGEQQSSEFLLRDRIKSYDHQTIKTLIYDLMDESALEAQKQTRKELRDTFFAPHYGNASQMAAHILSMLQDKIAPDGNSGLARRLLLSLRDSR
jgi:CDP-glycerol glycerophosphotransferase (TagB/SpsB family)